LGDLVKERDWIDLAFVLLHGKYGEDGRMQGMLDILGIPYVGSGVLASAMALNKRVAKGVYREQGLRVPQHVVLRQGERYSRENIMERLGEATVVKPVAEGSSLGASVCQDEEGLAIAIQGAFEFDDEVLVEEYLPGSEITCCVLGNRELEVLPLIEIVPDSSYRFFDYDAKYTEGATQEICPASVSESVVKEAQGAAKAAHLALGCRDWSRTDMIVMEDVIYVLETNTIPGMTKNSLFPLAARTAGWSFSDLLDRLVALAVEGMDGE
jgi:D-alanine-D-alanine ligase